MNVGVAKVAPRVDNKVDRVDRVAPRVAPRVDRVAPVVLRKDVPVVAADKDQQAATAGRHPLPRPLLAMTMTKSRSDASEATERETQE